MEDVLWQFSEEFELRGAASDREGGVQATTKEDIFNANVLGWCIEWVRLLYLVGLVPPATLALQERERERVCGVV